MNFLYNAIAAAISGGGEQEPEEEQPGPVNRIGAIINPPPIPPRPQRVDFFGEDQEPIIEGGGLGEIIQAVANVLAGGGAAPGPFGGSPLPQRRQPYQNSIIRSYSGTPGKTPSVYKPSRETRILTQIYPGLDAKASARYKPSSRGKSKNK